MTCSQTEKVSLLIDGELAPAEALKVERHLQECVECHDAHESFVLLRGQLTSYHSSVDAAAVEAALAKVLSQRDVFTGGKVAPPDWRERLAATFGSTRAFSFRFAGAAALIVLAATIASVALLWQQPRDVAINSMQPNTPAIKPDLPAKTSDARKPQAQKGGSDSQPTAPRKGGVKPKPAQTPERNVSRPPRRTEIPPNYSVIEDNIAGNTRPVADGEVELLTARHLEQSELLLRAFRNVRTTKVGEAPDVSYEQQRAQKLLYQNILVRREADQKGDVQVATLLGSLEPILLDIANLRKEPRNEEVAAIKERVERKNLVPLLQINSAAVARAYD
jgi:negative regulator of sigma E activity